MMTQILKTTQLVQQYRMPQVQIRGSGIEPRLDPEWATQSELLSQLFLQQKLAATVLDDFQLIRNQYGHGSTRYVLVIIISSEIPVDELVDNSVDVIRSAVLVIKVVCMLPYIYRQQWR